MRVIVKHRVPFIVATEVYEDVHLLAVGCINLSLLVGVKIKPGPKGKM